MDKAGSEHVHTQGDSVEAPESLRFERRSATRAALIGRMQAVRVDPMNSAGTIDLHLRDESLGGLGAIVADPMPPGARLRVCTSPHANVWRDGVVVRCEPVGEGYRMGIRFERRMAA